MIKRPEEGMTLIVKTITRLTVGLIMLFGIYIVLHGHLTPGGGFAGGVIVALSFIHLMLVEILIIGETLINLLGQITVRHGMPNGHNLFTHILKNLAYPTRRLRLAATGSGGTDGN